MDAIKENLTPIFCKWGCGRSLKNEEELEEHRKTCQYKIVDCPNCEVRMARRLFLTHIYKLCEYRSIECSDCNDIISLKNLEDHEQACPHRELDCENNREKVLFKDKETHSGELVSSEPKILNTSIKYEAQNFTSNSIIGEDKMMKEQLDQVVLENQDMSSRISNLEGSFNDLKGLSHQKDLTLLTEVEEIKSRLKSFESSFHQCVKEQQTFNAGITERLSTSDRSLASTSECMTNYSKGIDLVLDLDYPNEVHLGGLTIWDIQHYLSRTLNKPPEDIIVLEGGELKMNYMSLEELCVITKARGKDFSISYLRGDSCSLVLYLHIEYKIEPPQEENWKAVACLISMKSDLMVAYQTSEVRQSVGLPLPRLNARFTFSNIKPVRVSFCIAKLN